MIESYEPFLQPEMVKTGQRARLKYNIKPLNLQLSVYLRCCGQKRVWGQPLSWPENFVPYEDTYCMDCISDRGRSLLKASLDHPPNRQSTQVRHSSPPASAFRNRRTTADENVLNQQ